MNNPPPPILSMFLVEKPGHLPYRILHVLVSLLKNKVEVSRGPCSDVPSGLSAQNCPQPVPQLLTRSEALLGSSWLLIKKRIKWGFHQKEGGE